MNYPKDGTMFLIKTNYVNPRGRFLTAFYEDDQLWHSVHKVDDKDIIEWHELPEKFSVTEKTLSE